jgi:hypothetical protein
MDINHLCATIKERIAVQLQEASDPGERSEFLIAALYETSRSVLPELGSPRKSWEYLEGQGAVLDLISFIAIPLIRGAVQERRGVAVLSEIGEGCLDPLLRKKLSVYAQELLAKSSQAQKPASAGRRWVPLLFGACAAAALALYFAWPIAGPAREPEGLVAAAPNAAVAPSASFHAPAYTPSTGAMAGDGGRERSGAEGRQSDRPAAGGGTGATQGEQTTRVRIVNNQVLVPVTLKNGGQSVRLELVLDTGATRTAIHEGILNRLPIDLRYARASQSEVADGRVIRSRIAKIDALVVGPFAMASVELELIPYNGAEGVQDGLLGMDFLARHRYQIDMDHELIRWF